MSLRGLVNTGDVVNVSSFLSLEGLKGFFMAHMDIPVMVGNWNIHMSHGVHVSTSRHR